MKSQMDKIAEAIAVMQVLQEDSLSILDDMLKVERDPNADPGRAEYARTFLVSMRDQVLNAVGLIQVSLRSPYVMENPRELSSSGETLTIFEVIDSQVLMSWLMLREIAPNRAEEFQKRVKDLERSLPQPKPNNSTPYSGFKESNQCSR